MKYASLALAFVFLSGCDKGDYRRLGLHDACDKASGTFFYDWEKSDGRTVILTSCYYILQ